MAAIARTVQAPLIVNGIGSAYLPDEGGVAGSCFRDRIQRKTGQEVGRYDKIHLVPWGEYVPFPKLFAFAHKLTGRVSRFTPGSERKVFLLDTQNGGMRRYGVFICYESVFADEVRQFARQAPRCW